MEIPGGSDMSNETRLQCAKCGKFLPEGAQTCPQCAVQAMRTATVHAGAQSPAVGGECRMPIRRAFQVLGALAALAAVAGLFYSLYPKWYFPASGHGRIRGNRITGKVEILDRTTGKWGSRSGPDEVARVPDDVPRVPAAELLLIDVSDLHMDADGEVTGTIYNGTGLKLSNVTVEVSVLGKDGQVARSRSFEVKAAYEVEGVGVVKGQWEPFAPRSVAPVRFVTGLVREHEWTAEVTGAKAE